jgi:hypothetical protein
VASSSLWASPPHSPSPVPVGVQESWATIVLRTSFDEGPLVSAASKEIVSLLPLSLPLLPPPPYPMQVPLSPSPPFC